MKPSLTLLAALATFVVAGCGSGDSGATTADQDKAFKDGQKVPKITMPPDANKPPANFKDSMPNQGGPGGPPPGAAGPGK